jgi:hypothetical protein
MIEITRAKRLVAVPPTSASLIEVMLLVMELSEQEPTVRYGVRKDGRVLGEFQNGMRLYPRVYRGGYHLSSAGRDSLLANAARARAVKQLKRLEASA